MNGKLIRGIQPHWLVLAAVLGCGLLAIADPILPYSYPVAGQLSNDVAALESVPNRTPDQNQQLSTDRSALNAFRRPSKTLSTDISILDDLNKLLENTGGYPPLLSDAINGYLSDFEARETSMQSEALAAPRSVVRTNALAQINSISNILRRADAAVTSKARISQLANAARKFPHASNLVHRAVTTPVRMSSMFARIGRIKFKSRPHGTSGFFTNGDFYIAATNSNASDLINTFYPDLVDIRRSIEIHLSGVTTNTPATYQLGTNGNTAVYTAIEYMPRHQTVTYTSIPESAAFPSTVTIEAITPRFMVGRFNFVGQIDTPLSTGDTNQFTTITNGEWQLNF